MLTCLYVTVNCLLLTVNLLNNSHTYSHLVNKLTVESKWLTVTQRQVNSLQLNADSLLGPVQSQQLTVNCQQLAVDSSPELMQMSIDGHIYIYIYPWEVQ